MRRNGVAAVLLVLVGACGGTASTGADNDDQDQLVGVLSGGHPGERQVPESLQGVDWQLREINEGGRARDVAEVDAALYFDHDHVRGHACNFYGAKTEQLTATDIRVGEFGTTLIGCGGLEGEIDTLTQRVLTTGATWELDEERLTITSGDVTLTYRPRDATFPSRTATPLVEGQVGSAQYQLAWESADGHVSVDWASRERPGTGFGRSGIGRSVTYEITHLEPSPTTVADRAFLFVPTTLSTGRAEFQPADGGPPVPLTEHRIPPAKTWKLFAGFVGASTRNGVVVAYDSTGREIMRSYELPS